MKSRLLLLVLPLLFCNSALGSTDERRLALMSFAKSEFQSSQNHCKSFAKVAEHATTLTSKTGEFLEDMRLVIIGADWSREAGKRGKYFQGVKTGDSGFKSNLKDGSSQVEHLMAAIYFGKMLPPAVAAAGGALVEIRDAWRRDAHFSQPDAILYALGGDIGERLHDAELHRVGFPIRRTVCE